ncbi:MAG: NAD-dependent epimerase/dehydratase family protein, partial [bacterium]|nr:NAD-dependent epimerase/dehydratase family protein [bacterium]
MKEATEKPQSILVTGGAGYLGSVLVPKLLDAGHRVTVFDCLLFGPEPLGSVSDNARFRLVEGDLRDHPGVSALVDDGAFDTVIHLAAISNDPSSELDP